MKAVRGDVVLITGGASGIGRLMALKFAKLGAKVIIWDLSEDLGAQVVAEIKKISMATPRAQFYKVDVTDREAVYATAQELLKKVKKVDILINNAGIVDGSPILETNDRMIMKTINVNATSHFWTIKAFLPGMVERKKGNIVSIASAAGIFGCGGMVDYSASKFAAVGLMVSLRQELQAMEATGVHCTVVCPSFIKTGMFEGVEPPRLSKWLMPEDVAEAVVCAVRRNQWKVLLPWDLALLECLLVLLPDWLLVWFVKFTRVAYAMKTFKQTRPHAQIEDDKSKDEKKAE